MNKEDLKRIFYDYVNDNFDIEDIGIKRNYYHSLRVMEISNLIALNENFNKKDIELANIIGLLHDYARFPQWQKYKTYNDLISVDHGDLAIKLLFENKDIEKFKINTEYYDEIYDSIKYHNKLNLSNELSIHNELLCKLLRDADKLDIFYLYGTDENLFKQDKNFISDKVKKAFYNNKMINKSDVQNLNDKIILDLGMVYDLNFKYSFKYLKENNLIDNMYKRINNKELFNEYFDYIKKYINERID